MELETKNTCLYNKMECQCVYRTNIKPKFYTGPGVGSIVKLRKRRIGTGYEDTEVDSDPFLFVCVIRVFLV